MFCALVDQGSIRKTVRCDGFDPFLPSVRSSGQAAFDGSPISRWCLTAFARGKLQLSNRQSRFDMDRSQLSNSWAVDCCYSGCQAQCGFPVVLIPDVPMLLTGFIFLKKR